MYCFSKEKGGNQMKTLQFKCTLLTDVILNVKAATEDNQSSLDFIPGNCFLGIVAAHYDDFGDKALEVFHSGKVKFGDAHPAFGKVRSLRVPASMYYPKLVGKSTLYIHHIYNREKDDQGEGGLPQQLKQCREGFYAFTDNDTLGHEVKVGKTFALKSAYDRVQRHSKDAQMFGYESIDKGAIFYFEVEVDDDSLADVISEYLIGEKHIGRSRTAQYGYVNIEPEDFKTAEGQLKSDGGLITVYADSRLIILDGNGTPTFRPTPAQLGISDENAIIEWDKSQIRTFQYAPWNGTRQTRDTDRCGIEKGSVFVVKTATDAKAGSAWVGNYRNEGFGHVIYNPYFLKADGSENGLAVYKLKDQEDIPAGKVSTINNSVLYQFLERKKSEAEALSYIYEKVNNFVESNKSKFNGDSFASQWGTIRSIAMQYPNISDLNNELFEKKKTVFTGKDNARREVDDAYLTHGVAAKKWKRAGRLDILKDFIKYFETYKNGKYTQLAVINLAAEMAKICKKQ